MPMHVTPIPFKPPRLLGLSERLLASHYENNYGGALRRHNAIEARLAETDLASAPGFELNGLKREQLIAANSVILHEVYFDGLGGEDGLGGPAVPPEGALAEAIARDFGGYEAWRREFSALGKALAGGSGWVVLGWSERLGCLVNGWSPDHTHCLADSVPVLALDMFEHAYHMDFGTDAGAYVDAYLQNIHWSRPARRFERAIGIAARQHDPEAEAVTVERLRTMLSGPDKPVLLDVCLAEDMAKRTDKISGAEVRAPESIDEWIDALPPDRPIVSYCVYGYQVSGNAVGAMRRRGLDARQLRGGIAAWHALGGETEPL